MSEEVIGETVESTEQLPAEETQEVENSSEATAEQEAQQPEEQKPARIPDSVQRRFNELTRQKYEAQRALEAQQQQIDTYKRLLEAQGTEHQPANVPAQDPTVIAQQIVKQQQFDQACNAVYEQGKAEYQDFDAAISNLSVLGIQPDFLEAVTSMDKPAAVLYALAADLDGAARIMSLPPVLQGRELERLAQKAAAPKSQPVSQAPAPIAPVDGRATVESDPSRMSTEEWMAWRNQQLASKRRK